ncbi:hypothetical protein P775_08790 [Puniceibacterium antarcticum]|uniref:NADH dehydrogenase subunit E n=2 Tax=Puniceibacterium antarcticum TaxID=1206336 RepID=A0A2G8RGI9_9RHOB|nr:hypothetical protein P775_08790 [Puniceibacterium antarcticum]
MAGAIGFASLVLLLVVGNTSWIGSIFLSVVATGVLGLMFSYLFCRPLPGPVVTTATAPRATSATPAQSVSDAKPEVATVSAIADSEAGAQVKPSKMLAGQDELATRKGSWKYDAPAAEEVDTPGNDSGDKPAALTAPRGGVADDLKKIKGIGPKLEETCNSMGFYHFDQIAAWSPAQVAWVDENLEGFKGRVTRDDWVAQAKALAAEAGTAVREDVSAGNGT